MDINNFILQKSEELPIDSHSDNVYNFTKKKCDDFLKQLKEIEAADFELFLKNNKDEMMGNPSQKRFVNLIEVIVKKCLNILYQLYVGDFYKASTLLLKLLLNSKDTGYKLCDLYANYLKAEFQRDEKTYYRCVDFEKNKDYNICHHLPFNLRHLANKGRYNMLGSIFLYLSDNKNTACSELGKLKPDNNRWVSEYKARRPILLADLRIPSTDDIHKMKDYDKFVFFITYPILLLCNIKALDNNNPFSEEYLFPQLLSQVLFICNEGEIPYYKKNNLPNFDGLCYSSMYNKTTCNLVIPTKLNKGIVDDKGKDILKNNISTKGYSKFIENELFTIDNSYKIQIKNDVLDIQQKK